MIDYDTPILDDATQPPKNVQVVTLPSLTYQVVNGRIIGKIDGKDAMLQAIDKIVKTERFVFNIYSDQYGNDFAELIGKEMPYVKAELTRMFDEAFKADDRIDSVTVNSIKQTSQNKILVNLTVETMFGNSMTDSEVMI